MTVAVGLPGFWVQRQRRQALIDRQLLQAVFARDTSFALDLLDEGADPNKHWAWKEMPGAGSNEKREMPTFWQLLKRLLPGHRPEHPRGITLLMVNFMACSPYTTPWHLLPMVTKRREILTRALIQHGADVNAQDDDGCTPLYWAVEDADGNTITILLRHGADPNLARSNGGTPLHRAAWDGHLAMLRSLLTYKANVNAQWAGVTPLMQAAEMDRKEIVRELLRHGTDVRLKDRLGRTVLDYAAPRSEVARMLTAAGAKKGSGAPFPEW